MAYTPSPSISFVRSPLKSMLATLALAVLTWGKKAEPEPEPASTLGMTLLAVGVCWVPPSV